MKNKRKGSIARNVIILTAACSWLCASTAIAKDMDYKVNQMFSNRVIVFNGEQENIKETNISEISKEEMLELKEENELTLKNQFVIEDDSDITYELIFEDGTIIPYYGNKESETRHLHDLKDTIMKVHKKLKDGSCETKYYEARSCTKCDLVFYDELIKTVVENPCLH